MKILKDVHTHSCIKGCSPLVFSSRPCFLFAIARLPNGQMLNSWLSEKNNLSVSRLNFRGAKKANKCCMFCILYLINISCPRKSIKNRGMSCNLLWVPTFMV